MGTLVCSKCGTHWRDSYPDGSWSSATGCGRCNARAKQFADIEQRLRDIAAGACGVPWNKVSETPWFECGEDAFTLGRFFDGVQIRLGIRFTHDDGLKTFAGLAAAIWEHQHE